MRGIMNLLYKIFGFLGFKAGGITPRGRAERAAYEMFYDDMEKNPAKYRAALKL